MKTQFSDIGQQRVQDSDPWGKGNKPGEFHLDFTLLLPGETSKATPNGGSPNRTWVSPRVEEVQSNVQRGRPRWLEFTAHRTREERAAQTVSTLEVSVGSSVFSAEHWPACLCRKPLRADKDTEKEQSTVPTQLWKEFMLPSIRVEKLTIHRASGRVLIHLVPQWWGKMFPKLEFTLGPDEKV